MRNKTWVSKVMNLLNILLFIVSILAFALPYLAPKLFPSLSVFTLFLPVLLIVNFLFFLFWMIQIKKRMIYSAIILLLGISTIERFYKFSKTNLPVSKNDFTIMSYNVRLFNLYEWLPEKNIPNQIVQFVKNENPDVLCIQEYSPLKSVFFNQYNYSFIETEGKKNKYGQAIFSKFPIVNSGTIEFPKSSNKVIYADIIQNKDTIRVYSMHLQSIKISKDINNEISEENSAFIFNRLSKGFAQQQNQAEILVKHVKDCPLPKIICGDLNNSAFSYVYRLVKNDMKDAFNDAGSGFGKSYNFKYYPARIDYFFVEKEFLVKEYNTFDSFAKSDHFPLTTRLELIK